jgi:hypothetical protein
MLSPAAILYVLVMILRRTFLEKNSDNGSKDSIGKPVLAIFFS